MTKRRRAPFQPVHPSTLRLLAVLPRVSFRSGCVFATEPSSPRHISPRTLVDHIPIFRLPRMIARLFFENGVYSSCVRPAPPHPAPLRSLTNSPQFGFIHPSSGEISSPLAILRGIDAISNTICSVIDAADFVRNAHADQGFRNAADDAFSSLAEYIQVRRANTFFFCRILNDFEVVASRKNILKL